MDRKGREMHAMGRMVAGRGDAGEGEAKLCGKPGVGAR